METAKAILIVDNMRQLWSKWNPGDFETQAVLENFFPFEYDSALAAIKAVYSDQKFNYIKPPMKQIREKIRLFGKTMVKKQVEPVLHFTIECIEHTKDSSWIGRKGGFWLGRESDRPDDIEGGNRAEWTRQEYERCYGGRWVVIRPKSLVEDDIPF